MTAPLAAVPPDHIPVVASTDDNYAAPLTVMFISLLENTADPTKVDLFVIDGGITESKKQKLKSAVEERKARVTFLEVNNDIYANFPTCAHISAPAYYRISIPELFEDSVKKCIYLDCDVIVKSDISKLWQVELDDFPIAAVENIAGSTYQASQLEQHDYFNSGVMLVNLKKWREDGIPDKVRTFKQEHPELISTNDQCALNGVFRGNWKRLDLEWNHQSGLFKQSPQVQRYLENGQLEKALWSPSIIHYIGWSKPWIRPCYHPLESEYLRYHALSPFGDEELKPVPERRKSKRFSLFKKGLRKKKWQKKYLAKGYSLYLP